MPTTFKAIVNPAQKRRDGTINVKIRVTHNRRSKKLATNIYLTDKQITKGGRIKDQRIIDQCEDIIRKWRNATNQLGVSADALDLDDIIRYFSTENGGQVSINFAKYTEKCITKMSDGSARTYLTTLQALSRFTDLSTLDMRDIKVSFLQAFEDFLRQEPRMHRTRSGLVATNGQKSGRAISLYMACIRHILNLAKEEYNDEDKGLVIIPNSPFQKYKIKHATSRKRRAIEPIIIQAIMNLPDWRTNDRPAKVISRRDLARDCFLLSFGLAGMNAADLYDSNAKLKGDVIIYNRQKTASRRQDDAEFHIRIEPCLWPLIEKYRDDGGTHLFKFHRWYKSPMAFDIALNHGLLLVDKALAENNYIANLLPQHITFYAARHSWATIARSSRLNIDKYTVHEGLNHVDDAMKITDIYIDRDYTNIWNANAKVLDLFDWSAIKK